MISEIILFIVTIIILVVGNIYIQRISKDIKHEILVMAGNLFGVAALIFKDYTMLCAQLFLAWHLVVFFIFYIKTWMKKLKIVKWLPMTVWGIWGAYAGFRAYIHFGILKMDLPSDEVESNKIMLVAFMIALLVSVIYIIVQNIQKLKDKRWIKILACGITGGVGLQIFVESICAENMDAWYGVAIAEIMILIIIIDMGMWVTPRRRKKKDK